MTYRERVLALAEEMGKITNPYPFNGGNRPYKESTIREHIPIAVIAIKHTEGAVALALCEAGYDFDCAVKWLKEQGLTPDTEQYKSATAGQQETK
jgi:hypothetical protein